jgi:YD repeat-containing protein
VLVLVIILIATNLVTLDVLAWYLLRPVEHPRPDHALARSLHRHQRPAVSTSSTRRVITIEILNTIELAGKRNRWAGIAGVLAPGITHRMVYDQAMKLVRRQLADERVVADVRLHVVRPDDTLQPPLPDTPPSVAFDPSTAGLSAAGPARPQEPAADLAADDDPLADEG